MRVTGVLAAIAFVFCHFCGLVSLQTYKSPDPPLYKPNTTEVLIRMNEPRTNMPVIVDITRDLIKDIGDEVTLSCTVRFAETFSVLWEKSYFENCSETILLSSDGTTHFKNSRLSLRYKKPNSTYMLKIRDVQFSDAGIYLCTIQLDTNIYVSKRVRLDVIRQPFFYDNSSSIVIVNENEGAILQCYAGGWPRPSVWYERKNNVLLPGGRGSSYHGNILVINPITREDRGIYYCFANNRIGVRAKRKIDVKVQFPPNVFTVKRRVIQKGNYDVDLECKVEAYPEPSIVWIKDGAPITNDHRYKITQTSPANEYTVSTLHVIAVGPYLYGTYECKVINIMGEAKTKIDLLRSDENVNQTSSE